MSTNGEIVRLKYYEGNPKIKTIDDDLLNEIENDLTQAFQMTFDLAVKIGAIVPHKTK
jgi:DNA-directed RNA polymerase subunit F